MKAYLLDTNVISEIMTTEPNQRVIDFLAQIKESYLSVITLHVTSHYSQVAAPRIRSGSGGILFRPSSLSLR